MITSYSKPRFFSENPLVEFFGASIYIDGYSFENFVFDQIYSSEF